MSFARQMFLVKWLYSSYFILYDLTVYDNFVIHLSRTETCAPVKGDFEKENSCSNDSMSQTLMSQIILLYQEYSLDTLDTFHISL